MSSIACDQCMCCTLGRSLIEMQKAVTSMEKAEDLLVLARGGRRTPSSWEENAVSKEILALCNTMKEVYAVLSEYFDQNDESEDATFCQKGKEYYAESKYISQWF